MKQNIFWVVIIIVLFGLYVKVLANPNSNVNVSSRIGCQTIGRNADCSIKTAEVQ